MFFGQSDIASIKKKNQEKVLAHRYDKLLYLNNSHIDSAGEA